MPPDAGAASARKDAPPRTADLSAEALAKADRRDGRAGGLFVTVSRKRLDYGRPLLQPGANSNSPPRWTAARFTGLGEFRAQSRLTTTPCHSTARAAAWARPVRPAGTEIVTPEADAGGDELGGLLDAIAQEVQGRTASICDGISADFAARIKSARKSLPRDQVAAAVTALKQAKKAAVQFVRESAAIEVRGLQKQAIIILRRHQLKITHSIIQREKLDF